MRRGIPDRSACIAAHPRDGKIGRDRRTAAAARPARVAIEIVGIARLAKSRTRVRDIRGQFVHVGLAEDHGSGVPELSYLECIRPGMKRRQRNRSGGRRHLQRFVVVFDQHGNAVQWTSRAARAALGIECVSDRQRLGIDRDDRVQRRPVLVVRRDPRQVVFDQLPGRHLPRLHRRLQFRNRLFHHVEARGRRPRRLRGWTDDEKARHYCCREDPLHKGRSIAVLCNTAGADGGEGERSARGLHETNLSSEFALSTKGSQPFRAASSAQHMNGS